jgi:hypothetical protein
MTDLLATNSIPTSVTSYPNPYELAGPFNIKTPGQAGIDKYL